MNKFLQAITRKQKVNKLPIIGITSARIINEGSFIPGITKAIVNCDYSDAITKYNGIPLIIPPTCTDIEIEKFVEICDGLLISGGKDVAPLLYNSMTDKKCGSFDYDVDVSHIKLIQTMIKSNKPILGICRGMQLINVALGGTLYQDIPTNISNCGGHSFGFFRDDIIHSVSLVPNTIINQIFKKDTIFVNSIHHQALKDLGKGIKVGGISPDGVIEVIYSEINNIIGVQWHPEMLLKKNEEMKCLFEVFIRSCNE